MLHPLILAAFLPAITLAACSPRTDVCTPREGTEESTSPEAPKPPPAMAPFAGLVGGAWQVTLVSGATPHHVWRWGPGGFSVSKWSNGLDGVDDPWAGEVLYWHPGRREVRVLSLHGDIPGVGRGVGEGSIRFDGETADGRVDLAQPRGVRKLATHWMFNGPDAYHDTLLEDSGSGFQTLAEWEFIRIPDRSESSSRARIEAPAVPPERLKSLRSLAGHVWQASLSRRGSAATEDVVHVQATIEWIPSLEVIIARVDAARREGAHLGAIEAYLFQDVGTEATRCLALSDSGDVYEGKVVALDERTVQLELTGHGGGPVQLQIGLALEDDGSLRSRVRTLDAAGGRSDVELRFEADVAP